MSMLRHFLDCNQKDSRKLFEGLKIMEQGEKYTEKLGTYPCIYLTMKDVEWTDFEEMLYSFQTELIELFMENRKLLESEKILDVEKELFNNILNLRANRIETQNALKLLSRMLYEEYEKPAYIIIDEYDVPLQNAYVGGYYDDAVKFLKSFFRATFKDNHYMEKTVLTGVSRVAKESIFSGANNFDVYTVLDNEFSEDFGITSEEINIWGLLVGTGYLKVTEVVDLAESIYKIKIVNNEIRILFSQIIREWFSNKVIGNDLNSIMKDLVILNLEEFKEKFKILVMQMFSYMDVGRDTVEN